jgi:hypothetical protein
MFTKKLKTFYLFDDNPLQSNFRMPNNHDDHQPKTRREKKGLDKQSVKPYTSKHVRQQEMIAEKRQAERSKKDKSKK